jgi:hypothetical protein
MIRACSEALKEHLDAVSSYVPPEAAVVLWRVATDTPKTGMGGEGILAARDALPREVVDSITESLAGHLPAVVVPFLGPLDPRDPFGGLLGPGGPLGGLLDPRGPFGGLLDGRFQAAPTDPHADPATVLCQSAPARIDGLLSVANPLMSQLVRGARLFEAAEPTGEHCARMIAGTVILSMGMLTGAGRPGRDHERAVIEIAIGLTVVIMRVLIYHRALRASWPKPLPPAKRTQLTTPAPVAKTSIRVGAKGGAAVNDPPDDADFAANGLVVVVPDGLVVRTGAAEGTVMVTLSVVEHEPVAQLQQWDEIVDVSVSLSTPTLATRHETLELPAGGDYRARVQARRRDIGVEEGPSGGEAYEVVIWPAAPAPGRVVRATDRLGHRLRGEPEPAAVDRPELVYRPVEELYVDATITVVVGLALSEVVTAFGADPTPRPPGDRFFDGLVCLELTPLGPSDHRQPGVLVVEPSHYRATERPVLEALSRTGRAASMFWNVNAVTRLSLAENGELLDSFEWFDEASHPDVLSLLEGLDVFTNADNVARGMLVIERFTGWSVTADLIEGLVGAGGFGYAVPRRRKG